MMQYVLKYRQNVGTEVILSNTCMYSRILCFHRKYTELNCIRSASAQADSTFRQ